MEEYQTKQEIRYDEKAQHRTFTVGDLVYMYALPQLSASPNWLPGTVSRWTVVHAGLSFPMVGCFVDISTM